MLLKFVCVQTLMAKFCVLAGAPGVLQVRGIVRNVCYCMCATVFVSVLEHIIRLKAS